MAGRYPPPGSADAYAPRPPHGRAPPNGIAPPPNGVAPPPSPAPMRPIHPQMQQPPMQQPPMQQPTMQQPTMRQPPMQPPPMQQPPMQPPPMQPPLQPLQSHMMSPMQQQPPLQRPLPPQMQQRAMAPQQMQQRPLPPPPQQTQQRPLPTGQMQQRPAGPAARMPQRPVAPDVAGVQAGMAQMAMSAPQGYAQQPQGYGPPQMMSGPPPGVRAAAVGDPRTLPRPDLSGAAVAMRVSAGDQSPKPPPPDPAAAFPDPMTGQMRPQMIAEPAACPPEIFVPASPRCIRLCTGAFPMSVALAKKYSMPLGAVVQPMAKPGPGEEQIPVVNFGSSGIVRCRRCRSYVNFSCSFRDGGRRWACSMCQFLNDCPADYFSPLDQNGRRRDAAQRPELHRGSVEFVAPAEYMVRPPMPPVYLFVLEVTPATANSGALAACVAGIKRSIDFIPNEGRTRVGVITFDSAVHFYTLRAGPEAEPSVSVVSDIKDMFLPTPDSILVQLADCRPAFEKALDMIAKTHSQTQGVLSSASCLGAALQGAQKAMEYTGGKLVVLAASRPTAGPGLLRDRGDASALGTDRERAVLRPDNSTYRQMAVEMSKYQISCDLFLCPPPPGLYMDVATLSQLVKFTGGELFFAPSFDAPRDAPRLQLAVHRTLSRETGFEAVMRIRATKSIRCSHFSGRFFVRSTDLLAMPNVDADKAYAVQFSFDESTVTEGPFCVQVALLYTTTGGERRIRVHTVAAPVTNSMADLFLRVDAAATANIFTRMAAEAIKDRALDELRKNLTEKVISALAKYREVCQSQYPAVAGAAQLLLPDAMALLPLYMHGLGKSPILSRDASGAFMYRFDDKAALIHAVDVMNVAETSALLYPNVIPVYPGPAPNETPVKHPDGVMATVSSLKLDTGFLIDDGRSIILWLGANVTQRFTTELLGPSVTNPVDPRVLTVELLRRGASVKGSVGYVYSIVNSVLASRRAALPFHVVPAGDQRMQPRVEALMTEDRSASSVNYREFLLEVQRKVSRGTAGRK